MTTEHQKRRTVHKALKESRKDTDVTDHSSGGMRCVAVQTEQEHLEMVEECGNDPDKRNRWRRDHPESLTASAKQHKLPKRKTTFTVPELPYE